jgi:hypothetical protein
MSMPSRKLLLSDHEREDRPELINQTQIEQAPRELPAAG